MNISSWSKATNKKKKNIERVWECVVAFKIEKKSCTENVTLNIYRREEKKEKKRWRMHTLNWAHIFR